MATAISVTFFPMARRIEAASAIASTRPRCGSFIATTWRAEGYGAYLEQVREVH